MRVEGREAECGFVNVCAECEDAGERCFTFVRNRSEERMQTCECGHRQNVHAAPSSSAVRASQPLTLYLESQCVLRNEVTGKESPICVCLDTGTVLEMTMSASSAARLGCIPTGQTKNVTLRDQSVVNYSQMTQVT